MELDLSSAMVLGVGGLAAGLMGLRGDRLGLGAALTLGGLGALAQATGRPALFGWPLIGLAALCFLLCGFRSERLGRAAARLGGLLRAPQWQWAPSRWPARSSPCCCIIAGRT